MCCTKIQSNALQEPSWNSSMQKTVTKPNIQTTLIQPPPGCNSCYPYMKFCRYITRIYNIIFSRSIKDTSVLFENSLKELKDDISQAQIWLKQ